MQTFQYISLGPIWSRIKAFIVLTLSAWSQGCVCDSCYTRGQGLLKFDSKFRCYNITALVSLKAKWPQNITEVIALVNCGHKSSTSRWINQAHSPSRAAEERQYWANNEDKVWCVLPQVFTIAWTEGILHLQYFLGRGHIRDPNPEE